MRLLPSSNILLLESAFPSPAAPVGGTAPSEADAPDAFVRPAPMGMAPMLLWQLIDSAFPTGGFAHSGGLEAAWQQGEVRNRAELHAFLAAATLQAGQGGLPFVNAAHGAPDRMEEWDLEFDSFTPGHVSNRASRLQGRAFLAGIARLGVLPPAWQESTHPPCGHLAPVLGGVLSLLGADRETAGRVYLFQQVRSWLAAAVRLSIVGPMEAQSVQSQLGPKLEHVRLRCADLGIEQAAQTAPLLEIWHCSHDRLFSRLFQT